MKKLFTFLVASLFSVVAFAQLPAGAFAPDFSLYEINRTTGTMITDQTINLYSMLNDYKTVYIDVSASTCSPCYSFHQTGTLETLYNNFGPNSTVNDSRVLFVEGAQTGNSWASLTGQVSGTWNCVNVPYPVIPLAIAPNAPNNYNSFHSGYNIAYFPTIYMICPNRQVFELDRDGTNQANAYHNLIATMCPTWTNTYDALVSMKTDIKSVYNCHYEFSPQIVLQNMGSATMTSAEIRITHNSDVQTINWTGNLEQFDWQNVDLPSVSGTDGGDHTYSVEVVSINGNTNQGTNSFTKNFLVQTSSTISELSQNFSSENITPWNLVDYTDGYCFVYGEAGALVFNAYSISNGGTAELSAPMLNFANVANPGLTFDIAYKRYNNNSKEKVQVKASGDCGETWTTVYTKQGAELATGANTSSNYVATASDYRTESVDLSAFANMDKVLLKFVFTSTYGNNVWLDNINIGNDVVAVENFENSMLSVYPNPAKDLLNVTYDKNIERAEIYDVYGRLVKTFTTVGNTINISDLSTGVYMINFTTEDGVCVKKIVKE